MKNNNKMKYNVLQSNRNIRSIKNKTLYDLRTAYSQRQNNTWNILYDNYQYNILREDKTFFSIKSAPISVTLF